MLVNKVNTVTQSILGMPQEMLGELVQETGKVGQQMAHNFQGLHQLAADIREQLIKQVRILPTSNLFKRNSSVSIPTVCATDGSHVKEQMLSGDIVAVCGVAVEGIAPPRTERHWEAPHYRFYLKHEDHHNELGAFTNALMFAYEMELARATPHQLVLLDFSFVAPAATYQTWQNKATTKVDMRSNLARELNLHLNGEANTYLTNYRHLLQGHADKAFVAVPKSTTQREILDSLQVTNVGNERAIMSLVLEEGEYTKPEPLGISRGAPSAGNWRPVTHVVPEIGKVHFCYYKPSKILPVFRLETTAIIVEDEQRLTALLRGIHHQAKAPGMLEPYPLYLADKMARSMNSSVPFISSVIMRTILDNSQDQNDLGDAMTMLLHYRTRPAKAAGNEF